MFTNSEGSFSTRTQPSLSCALYYRRHLAFLNFQENEHFEDEKLYLAGMGLIGHFRVPKTLTFKMRLGAQPCENEFYLRENEK